MADAVAVFAPGQRLIATDGTPYAGATIAFYDAGSTDARLVYSDAALTSSLGSTVYTDSAGYPVTAQGGSTKTLVYTNTDSYKMVITDSVTAETITHDNIKGAVVSGTEAAGSGITQAQADVRYIRNANALSTITTIADADILPLWDTSAAANVGITYANVKTLLYSVGGTDVPVTDGGTGSSTASGARTNLGVTATGSDTTYNYRANNLSDVASAATAFTNIKQAASDSATGVIEIAVQSEMESASSTTLAVTPGRQQYHPGVAKFWAYVTVSGGTPTLAASHNVTGITDVGTGQLSITINTDFSSSSWCCVVGVTAASTTAAAHVDTIAAGTVSLVCRFGSDGVATDPTAWHIVGYGDQ